MSLESRLMTTEYFKEWDAQILLEILENADNAVIIIDCKGTVVYINRFYAEHMNIKLEKLMGRNLYDIEPQAKLLRVMEDGGGRDNDEVEYIKSLNIDSVGLAFPLYDSRKEKVGACAIFKDVTHVVELTRKLQKSKEMVQYLASQLEASELPISFQSYISQNKDLQKTLSLAAKVANTNCTILIQGGSGERPMIKVNCASIPENLLESELFGYEEGAFTGARKGGKLGKFELANKGTILLDEIGDMSLTMQSKLLRVLQEKELERVGGTKTIKLDVRVIAATNRNLEEMVEKNEFRSDLYYRLHVVPIHIPALRYRREDIMPLVRYFIERNGGDESTDLTPGAARMLEEYGWPGNVRELQNVIEYAMIVKTGDILEIKDFPQYLRGDGAEDGPAEDGPCRLKDAVERLEKSMMQRALKRNNGNKSMAINELGLSRRSFYEKLEKYGLK